MADRQCESFIVAKADFASFVVIMRKTDNTVERVGGFKTDGAARDWIANRISGIDCDPELPAHISPISTLLSERHDVAALR